MPDDGRRYAPVDAPSWPVTESVTEYETTWYTGGYDMVVHPDGSQKRYYWAELAAAVVIVAVTEDAVVCVEQYRPTIRQRHLELPAGIVEADESYPAAGRRELGEGNSYLWGAVEGLAAGRGARRPPRPGPGPGGPRPVRTGRGRTRWRRGGRASR